MKILILILSILTICHLSCAQTKIEGQPITNLPPKKLFPPKSDHLIYRKVELILRDALPKIVEERFLLNYWDMNNGTIKLFYQLDSTFLIENKFFFTFNTKFNINDYEKHSIPDVEKLDCLLEKFRYKFELTMNKKNCDIIVSPEIIDGKDRFRYFKFHIPNSEIWMVKIKYKQNWNDDCYTSELIDKIVTIH